MSIAVLTVFIRSSTSLLMWEGGVVPERWKADREEGARMSETRTPVAPAGKTLAAAARRALEEAAARRAEIDARAAAIAGKREHRGRGGLEPVRYADWEVKGLATDF
jgi:hypothetical protein